MVNKLSRVKAEVDGCLLTGDCLNTGAKLLFIKLPFFIAHACLYVYYHLAIIVNPTLDDCTFRSACTVKS